MAEAERGGGRGRGNGRNELKSEEDGDIKHEFLILTGLSDFLFVIYYKAMRFL